MSEFAFILGMLVIVGLICWFAFKPLRAMSAKAKRLKAAGEMETATVVSVRQTGLEINDRPQMEIVLDIQLAGVASRRVTVKEILDLGSIPRAGDLIYVLVDPQNPDTVMLAGAPRVASSGPKPTLVPATFVPSTGSSVDPRSMPDPATDEQVMLDTFSIAPRLREHGPRAVADVLAMSRTATNATRFELELDAINAPKRRITLEQVMYGDMYSVGDRVYLLTDDADPNSFAIVPLSWTGGQKLERGTNRLDPLVLGPALLYAGAKAQGTILTAKRMPLGNPSLKPGDSASGT